MLLVQKDQAAKRVKLEEFTIIEESATEVTAATEAPAHEITSTPSAPSSNNNSPTLIQAHNYCKVTTVENLLKTFYGANKYDLMAGNIPNIMKEGLVKGSHCTRLLRDFPRTKIFRSKSDLDHSIPSAGGHATTNFLTQDILKYFFLRDSCIIAPPNTYGLDPVIPPVLLKRDSRSASDVATASTTNNASGITGTTVNNSTTPPINNSTAPRTTTSPTNNSTAGPVSVQ